MLYSAHDEICKVDALVGAFLMVRRKAINQVGTMDESFFLYCEEIDWCKRFWNKGWQVVFFPQAEVIHYLRASSSKEPIRFYKESYRSRYKFWKKYHGRLKQVAFVAIMLLRQIIRIIMGTLSYIIKPKDRKNISSKIKANAELLAWFLSR